MHRFFNLHQWEEAEKRPVEPLSGISKAHDNVDKLYPLWFRKLYGSRVDGTPYELVYVRCKVCDKTKILRIPIESSRTPSLERAFPLLSTLLGAFSVIGLGLSLFGLGLPLGAAAIILSCASLEREGWTPLGAVGLILGLVGLLVALWTLRPPYVP